MKREENHAEQNARGWSETIKQMVAALEVDYDQLQDLRDEETKGKAEDAELLELEAAATIDGDLMKDADAVRERIQESPLSVEVRSGWASPGDDMQAEEFCILLSTGGPALRIIGELDEHKQPRRAWLEYQDWGTPWTEFHGEGAPAQADLVTFSSQFYFGE
jgi:hypothetical protein